MAATGVRTTTYAELRRRAAVLLDDLVQVAATSAGTNATLIDAINIPTGNEDLVRRQIVFTDATFSGQKRVITACDHSTHTITFSPVLGAATDDAPVQTTADIFNKRGMGYPESEYLLAAKMTQDDAYPIHQALIEGTATAFDANSNTYSIASTFNEVHEVLYQDPEGDWYPIPKSKASGYGGWQANMYDNEIVITGPYRYGIDGFDIKVIGWGREDAITGDSSTTQINPEWFVQRMCYHLSTIGLGRDVTGTRAKKIMDYKENADSRLKLIRTQRRAYSATVRNS